MSWASAIQPRIAGRSTGSRPRPARTCRAGSRALRRCGRRRSAGGRSGRRRATRCGSAGTAAGSRIEAVQAVEVDAEAGVELRLDHGRAARGTTTYGSGAAMRPIASSPLRAVSSLRAMSLSDIRDSSSYTSAWNDGSSAASAAAWRPYSTARPATPDSRMTYMRWNSARARSRPGGRVAASDSSSATAPGASPALCSSRPYAIRRRASASVSAGGVSRQASRSRSAAASGAPRRQACSAAPSRASATCGSGPSAAIARWRARSSRSSESIATARCRSRRRSAGSTRTRRRRGSGGRTASARRRRSRSRRAPRRPARPRRSERPSSRGAAAGPASGPGGTEASSTASRTGGGQPGDPGPGELDRAVRQRAVQVLAGGAAAEGPGELDGVRAGCRPTARRSGPPAARPAPSRARGAGCGTVRSGRSGRAGSVSRRPAGIARASSSGQSTASAAGRPPAPGGADQPTAADQGDPDRRAAQPADGERQRAGGRRIEPLDVVDREQDRAGRARPPGAPPPRRRSATAGRTPRPAPPGAAPSGAPGPAARAARRTISSSIRPSNSTSPA